MASSICVNIPQMAEGLGKIGFQAQSLLAAEDGLVEPP